jgi:hypothetical protein
MLRRLSGLFALFMLAPWGVWGASHWLPVSVSWNLPWGDHWVYLDGGWMLFLKHSTGGYPMFSRVWPGPVYHYNCVHVFTPAFKPETNGPPAGCHYYTHRWQFLFIEAMRGRERAVGGSSTGTSIVYVRPFTAVIFRLGWVLLIIHAAAIGLWWRCRRTVRRRDTQSSPVDHSSAELFVGMYVFVSCA